MNERNVSSNSPLVLVVGGKDGVPLQSAHAEACVPDVVTCAREIEQLCDGADAMHKHLREFVVECQSMVSELDPAGNPDAAQLLEASRSLERQVRQLNSISQALRNIGRLRG